jgi:Mg-chelatase subunit ChlD
MKRLFLLSAISLFALNALSAQAAVQQVQERVEVAFVLDTTGSMADLIDGAKRKIWSIASTVVDTNPDAEIAMALVAYRDRGDDYVVQTTPLSEDIQGLYGKLVKLEADGGGDTPESVNEALQNAINDLKWSSGNHVKRIVFLVGDAPPHMDYEQERQYPRILKDAQNRDIIVNTVQAGDIMETTPIWKEIAQYGGGRYMAIPQSGGDVVVIVSPYDDEILELQGELDTTVVPYGRFEQKVDIGRKMVEKAAAAPSVKLDNSKFYAKRSKRREVITGGDLIGDVRNNSVELDGIVDTELPDELRNMPKDERKAWVAERLDKRTKMEARMNELISKRDAFVIEEKAKTKTATNVDSFDSAVEDTLKAQLN